MINYLDLHNTDLHDFKIEVDGEKGYLNYNYYLN